MGSVLHGRYGIPCGRFLQELQPVLELGEPELELDEVVLAHKSELAEDGVQRGPGSLAEPRRIPAPARRKILDQGPCVVAAGGTPPPKPLCAPVRAPPP